MYYKFNKNNIMKLSNFKDDSNSVKKKKKFINNYEIRTLLLKKMCNEIRHVFLNSKSVKLIKKVP